MNTATIRSQALIRLRTAGAYKNNWYRIAKCISDTMTAGGWEAGAPTFQEWLLEAANATGLTTNTLTRMLAVLSFYEDRARESSASAWKGDPSQIPFTALEILKRIHAIDSTAADALATAAINGQMSSRQLNQRYETIVNSERGRLSGRVLSKRDGLAFEGLALTHLCRAPESFCCPANVTVYPHVGSRRHLLSMTAVARTMAPDKRLIGVDAFYSDTRSDIALLRRANQIVYRIAYTSSFFDGYVVVFPASTDPTTLLMVGETLALTGREHVSIVTLATADDDREDRVEVIVAMKPGAQPVPDCRGLVDWQRRLLRPFRPDQSL